MADVSVADMKEESTSTQVHRVDSVESLQQLLPYIAHDEWVMGYVTRTFRDPKTLILAQDRACLIASIVDHPFFENVCIIVWIQNPDGVSTREFVEEVEGWARENGSPGMVGLISESSKLWKRMRAARRRYGFTPYRIVLFKEL